MNGQLIFTAWLMIIACSLGLAYGLDREFGKVNAKLDQLVGVEREWTISEGLTYCNDYKAGSTLAGWNIVEKHPLCAHLTDGKGFVTP